MSTEAHGDPAPGRAFSWRKEPVMGLFRKWTPDANQGTGLLEDAVDTCLECGALIPAGEALCEPCIENEDR